MIPSRNPYPTDASNDKWAFVAPYLILLPKDASQRTHRLRWIVRASIPRHMMPNDLLPWRVVCQQTQRLVAVGCFSALVDDLYLLLREAKGHYCQPLAAILNSRILQSTPESGGHAGYDGAKRRKGSKVHAVVDTLSHLLALLVTPANEQVRAHVSELAQAIQDVMGRSVEVAFVDQGSTGEVPAETVQEHGLRLGVVKLPEAKQGFVLLPRRWMVERSSA